MTSDDVAQYFSTGFPVSFNWFMMQWWAWVFIIVPVMIGIVILVWYYTVVNN